MSDLPNVLEEAFPEVEPPGRHDRVTISRQLGRKPSGKIFIARRCPMGVPAVIVTMPEEYMKKGPQPPLLWLSCPSAAKAAGNLESMGLMEEFKRRIESDDELRSVFQTEEDGFSHILEAAAFDSGGIELAVRFKDRGAAGGVKYRVKCLHAHLAYHLAHHYGLLGEWCIEELGGPGRLWCEKTPKACVD